jgi:hypothetical protein
MIRIGALVAVLWAVLAAFILIPGHSYAADVAGAEALAGEALRKAAEDAEKDRAAGQEEPTGAETRGATGFKPAKASKPPKNSSGAAPDDKASKSVPIEAKVGYELLGIRNVNPLSGEFEAIFNLSFTCSADCEPSGFLLENGRIVNAAPVVKTPRRKVFLVRSQVLFDVETKTIPFDKQRLEVFLRAEEPGIRYVLDEDATPTKLSLSVMDWKPDTTLLVEKQDVQSTPGEPEPFRYKLGLDVHRTGIWSFLRFMLPSLALMTSAFLVLILPDDFKTKLGMGLAAFIGLIFLQLSVGGRVPVRDELPFWDKYLLVSYATVAGIVGFQLFDNWLKEKEKADLREKFIKASKYAFPAFWLGGELIIAGMTFF